MRARSPCTICNKRISVVARNRCICVVCGGSCDRDLRYKSRAESLDSRERQAGLNKKELEQSDSKLYADTLDKFEDNRGKAVERFEEMETLRAEHPYTERTVREILTNNTKSGLKSNRLRESSKRIVRSYLFAELSETRTVFLR